MALSTNSRVLSQGQATSADSSTVTGITVPTDARSVVLAAQSQDAWVSFIATDPSATHGFRLINGAQPIPFDVVPGSGNTLKVVSTQPATAAKVDYLFRS